MLRDNDRQKLREDGNTLTAKLNLFLEPFIDETFKENHKK